MNELLKLNALLRLYESNFLNLHWNAKEEDFKIEKGMRIAQMCIE